MQGEPALVGADIERLAVRVSRSGGIVLALVEERPGLLSGASIVVKIQAV